VHVFDRAEQGACGGKSLEQLAEAVGDLRRADCLLRQADGRGDRAPDLWPGKSGNALACLFDRVLVVNSGCLPDDLGQRPVGDALAVGEAAPGVDGGPVGQLGDQLATEA
jgi:hypothetical protein